jgi:hypothetical protein
MYDSVTAKRLPPNATLVAAYTDGHYANEAAVRAQCPHATIVRITVRGNPDREVIDCETGDATPEQAAAWAATEIKAGRRPTIYCNLSTWPEVQRHVKAHGIAGKVCYWIAHYDGKAEMIPGAVAKQYIERKDQNLDYSIAADYWPGVDQAPTIHKTTPPPKPPPAKPLPDWVPSWYTHVIQPGQHDQSIVAALKVWADPKYPPTQVTLDAHIQGLFAEIQRVTGEPITGALTARTAYSIQHWGPR